MESPSGRPACLMNQGIPSEAGARKLTVQTLGLHNSNTLPEMPMWNPLRMEYNENITVFHNGGIPMTLSHVFLLTLAVLFLFPLQPGLVSAAGTDGMSINNPSKIPPASGIEINSLSGSHLPLTPTDQYPPLKNFAMVSKELYRGEQPTAEGFRKLKSLGVKTIINLRALHSDRAMLKGLGLNYCHLYFKTWHPEKEDILKFLKVAMNPKYQPVFVHCQHGADRTGMMVAIWRVFVEGWAKAEAKAELPNFGFHSIWKNILNYFDKLDIEKLEAELDSSPAPKVERVK